MSSSIAKHVEWRDTYPDVFAASSGSMVCVRRSRSCIVSIPLTFALVIALVVVVYFFVWGADRVRQRSQATGDVPQTQSDVDRASEIDSADR